MEVYSRFTITLTGLFFWCFSVFAHDISGTVRLEPPFPEAKKINVDSKYQGACSEEQNSESLIVSQDGFVKNAVVFLEGDFDQQFKSEIPTLDQKNCHFEPHVLIVKSGSPFRFANSDPMAHDIRAFDQARMLYMFEMNAEDKSIEQNSNEPGIYVIRCGLHKWMHAFVVSAPHSFYAVSNEQGQFELRGVPEGTHTLKIWHETLGEAEIPIEVKDSISDFSYTFKPLTPA